MIKIVIVGFGNIGKFALDAVTASKDMKLLGIVKRNALENEKIDDYPVISDVDKLSEKPDVALLCTPTSAVLQEAQKYHKLGISTVDCFDRHQDILMLRKELEKSTKENGVKAIISAGWDPGSDSVVRTLLEAIAPKGITNTNFGSGMSMGHSVVAKSFEGVKKALSMTIPLGSSLHRRMVYVELEDGADFAKIEKQILEHDSFSHDDSHVVQVSDVDSLMDMGHGVVIERKGVSGNTHNQLIEFKMKINNPAATSQIMVGCARAIIKQPVGVYTMIELPPVNMLEGTLEENIKKLV